LFCEAKRSEASDTLFCEAKRSEASDTKELDVLFMKLKQITIKKKNIKCWKSKINNYSLRRSPYFVYEIVKTIETLPPLVREALDAIETYKKEMNICAICYGTIEKKETLVCNHSYCNECLIQLFFIYIDDKCPVCRKTYTAM
jgi:hypothetical protein